MQVPFVPFCSQHCSHVFSEDRGHGWFRSGGSNIEQVRCFNRQIHFQSEVWVLLILSAVTLNCHICHRHSLHISEVSSSQSGDLDRLGKTLWLAVTTSGRETRRDDLPSYDPRHRYLVYELMTGGDIYDRLMKSRKRQNPVAFHWPGSQMEWSHQQVEQQILRTWWWMVMIVEKHH